MIRNAGARMQRNVVSIRAVLCNEPGRSSSRFGYGVACLPMVRSHKIPCSHAYKLHNFLAANLIGVLPLQGMNYLQFPRYAWNSRWPLEWRSISVQGVLASRGVRPFILAQFSTNHLLCPLSPRNLGKTPFSLPSYFGSDLSFKWDHIIPLVTPCPVKNQRYTLRNDRSKLHGGESHYGITKVTWS
jgi:hypothetical protein